jgi:hypothetical protein
MRLRLRITSPGGDTSSFEHSGPSIRIGRKPGCELELGGADNQSISREHARIDLAAKGATLVDLGSINGTLLNDRRIPGPKPLRVGDRIRLGTTGATLTVVELDVGYGPVVANSRSTSYGPWIGAAAIGALFVVALVLIIVAMKSGRSAREADAAERQSTTSNSTTPSSQEPSNHGETTKPHSENPPQAADAPSAEPPGAADEDRETPVASYVVLPQWGPSILLDQRSEGYPRARLRPEARVLSSHTLLCLPGYRAHLQGDRGVHVTLWGNVPEFCAVPPLLLESAVILKAESAAEIDLDLTLLRGRVHLANAKKDGPAKIRLRYLREIWELTLSDSNSEVVAELWGMLAPASEKASSHTLPLRLGLFTKGAVSLRTPLAETPLELPNHSRVSRVNEANSPLYRTVSADLPDWWARPPDAKQARVADVMLSLKDWENRLREPGDLTQDIFRHTESQRGRQPNNRDDDPTFRSLGVYFLGSFDGDGIPLVVRLLEDPDYAEVRRAAAHALRAWLARDNRHDSQLTPILQARIDPPQRAADVQRLLYPFPTDTVNDRQKWTQLTKELLALLEDKNIALRDLAAWHLEELARGSGAPELPFFDAGADVATRIEIARKWKRILNGAMQVP